MNMKEGDYIEHLHVCSTHDYLLFFTNQGKVYRLKVYELPEGSRASRGRALVNVLPLKDKEKVMTVIPTRDFSEGKFLVFGTAQGMVKKTPFKDYDTPIRADGIIAINIRKGDELVRVRMTSGKDDIIMTSKSGHAARFSEKQARPMGRATAGVKGMNVSDKGNRVLSLDVVDHSDTKGDLLVVTENGYGKRTPLVDYPVKGRGAKGMLTVEADRQEGRPRRRARRPRGPGADLHLPERDGAAQRRRRHLEDGPRDPGRPGDEPEAGRPRQRGGAGGRVRERQRQRRRSEDPSLEDEAPSESTVADEAAEAEAAGNGEAKVTKAPRRRSSGSKAPAKPPAKGKANRRRSRRHPPRRRRRSPSVKPKPTATAKQRAESERKKK